MINKIDFHTHFIPKNYADYLEKYYAGKADGVLTPEWSPTEHLQLMQDTGITHSVISLSSPHPSLGSASETKELIQAINLEAEHLSQTYPDKFSFCASLPLPSIENSLETIQRFSASAFGFAFPTNCQGIYLGDAKLDEIMADLNTRKAKIMIHPTEPHQQNIHAAETIKTPLMEFFFDTTRAIVNLAANQIFSRYPNITWIIPHAGALLPVIAQRITEGNKFLADPDAMVPDNLLEVLQQKNLYFDLAGMVLPYQLPTLLQIISPEQLLYGADFPYTPAKTIQSMAQKIEDTPLFSAEEKQLLFYKNAQTLLGK
ncbi:amidohydrolase family protein [Enterococcus hermanniensis]|uniref:6-methylsalicylate decarboxylase n=1 Tax=Enterococcus hermanniensis TaxID=249189 RepID=A0A1L8TMM9_9ENTE|nr:amidohydrolase family protein [Enterococcus hermanniensis]OJG45595.1 amidohydrolase [Enterococcus hermanniensis]